ncbi:MAG: hypothetical protein OEQ74_00195 [Gammaproteobacteria bacterium]|nr:hypothetical protein [Gammaproteobacteria bacterium]
MVTISQFWLALFAIFMAGAGLGAYSLRRLTRRHSHKNDVRWQRLVQESKEELERELAKLTKTLDHTRQKKSALRRTLSESEETVRLLSAKHVPAYETDIAERDKRLAELNKRLSHARAKLADAKDQEETDKREIEKLHTELANRDQRVDDLLTRNTEFSGLKRLNTEQEKRFAEIQAELESARSLNNRAEIDFQNKLRGKTHALQQAELNVAELKTRIERFEKTAPDYQAELKERDQQIASLSQEFEVMRRRLPTLNDALRERETSIEDLIAELSQERKKAALLQEKISQSAKESPVEVHRASANVINLQPHLDADAVARNLNPENAEQRIQELETELEQWKRKHHAVKRRKDHIVSNLSGERRAGSLQQIRGIGPALETTLNDLGIMSIDQLAMLNQDDIAAMAEKDSSLPRRINRGEWIEQARQLVKSDQRDRRRPRA